MSLISISISVSLSKSIYIANKPINNSHVKYVRYFLALAQRNDQDRIVTVIIVQVPDTFAQEALTSSPSLTHRQLPKFHIPLTLGLYPINL